MLKDVQVHNLNSFILTLKLISFKFLHGMKNIDCLFLRNFPLAIIFLEIFLIIEFLHKLLRVRWKWRIRLIKII